MPVIPWGYRVRGLYALTVSRVCKVEMSKGPRFKVSTTSGLKMRPFNSVGQDDLYKKILGLSFSQHKVSSMQILIEHLGIS